MLHSKLTSLKKMTSLIFRRAAVRFLSFPRDGAGCMSWNNLKWVKQRKVRSCVQNIHTEYCKHVHNLYTQVSYRFLTADNFWLVLSQGRLFYGAGEGWFRKRVKIKIILIYIQLIFIVFTQSHNRPCA